MPTKTAFICRTCYSKFHPRLHNARRLSECPACRKAKRLARNKLKATRGDAGRKRKADAYLQARREGRTGPSYAPAPHLQAPLDQLIADADAASARALKAAANPAAIEPREAEPEPLGFEAKLELVMLYGDVSQRNKNRWLLERGRRQYVDYFAPDSPAEPDDEQDKALLAEMLGLRADPEN